MTGRRMIRWLVAALLLCGFAAFVAGRVTAARATDRLAAATATDARLRMALLTSEIARYRLLPLAMADDRDLVAALSGAAGAVPALNAKLEGLARRTGAAVIYVIGPDGRAMAASNWRARTSFIGN
ncbi:MAG: sensor histidine kinase, partial [Sphingomonas sp.]